MQKILIVARREFLSRVQKKTFLLTTLGLPVLVFLLYAMIIYFMVKSHDEVKIAVADNANVFKGKLDNSNNELQFSFVKSIPEDSLKAMLTREKYDAYVWIPDEATAMDASGIRVMSGKTIGLMTQGRIENAINSTLENRRLVAQNLTPAQIDSIQKKGAISFTTLSRKEEKKNAATVSYAIGYGAGLLIYMILFIYGAMVMRGVVEEKVNRIAEVIVSSIKPFQLMMGKIFGIGAVGLAQFLIWFLLIFILQMFLPLFFPGMMGALNSDAMGQVPGMSSAGQIGVLSGVFSGMGVNLPLILICFVFYFLGGYLLYSSLFAAVGSLVNEDPQDAQSLMFPIMMPIIFAFIIMTKAVNDPNSGIALFGSLFPFTSPIVMMSRIAYNPPVWQIVTSFALLIVGFLLTSWFAARIYRTGILLYGKKPTWKEIMKWAFR